MTTEKHQESILFYLFVYNIKQKKTRKELKDPLAIYGHLEKLLKWCKISCLINI